MTYIKGNYKKTSTHNRVNMESKNRDTQEKPGNEIINQWHDDSSNWKLGIFYFNKKDKRVFP
jgi:uncharacterized membrane protein